MANPYLGFAALLMAGLDGIKNKIHPGAADGQGSVRPAAEGTEEDPDRLRFAARSAAEPRQATATSCTDGGVFDDDQIDAYIELKMAEVMRFEMTPHPVEFDMYYSV